MTGTGFLLDTNIILYLLRGDPDIPALIKDKDVYVSFITEMELLSFPKLTTLEKSKIESLLNDALVVEFNAEIKKTAISIRSRYGFGLPDSIIAATSIFMNLPLLSADKDLHKIKEVDFILLER